MTTARAFHSHFQYTLASPVRCEGVGLHSGDVVRLTAYPAEASYGIRFVRGDLPELPEIPAQAALVSETRLGTTLTNEQGVSISTVEHLMAALWGAGIDNARIVVEGAEVPIMDGSSAPFMAMIESVGVRKQSAPRQFVELLEPLELTMGESMVRLTPHDGFAVDIAVEYNHPSINQQAARYDFRHQSFAQALSQARTFGFAHEVEMMQRMGLARGGSLENAIVLGEDAVLNPEGLRFDDEFVRHKALDLVGDLFLAGYRLRAKVEAYKPGHHINTAMAELLMNSPHCWCFSEHEPATQATPIRETSLAYA